MTIMWRVTIKLVGSNRDPNQVARSGAPIGKLATSGMVGTVIDNSPKYNSSFLVDFGGGQIYDIHDQHFERVIGIWDAVVDWIHKLLPERYEQS